MPKILCKRQNASLLISGVRFEKGEGGMISEEVSQEVADRFSGITGYEIIAEPLKPNKPNKPAIQVKPTEQENDASVES